MNTTADISSLQANIGYSLPVIQLTFLHQTNHLTISSNYNWKSIKLWGQSYFTHSVIHKNILKYFLALQIGFLHMSYITLCHGK